MLCFQTDRQTQPGFEPAYFCLLTVARSLMLQPAETLHFWNRSGFELLLATDFLARFLEAVCDLECLMRDVIFRTCYTPAWGWDLEQEGVHQGAAARSSGLFFQTGFHGGKQLADPGWDGSCWQMCSLCCLAGLRFFPNCQPGSADMSSGLWYLPDAADPLRCMVVS